MSSVGLNDRDRFHGGKMMPVVGLDELKKELERSRSQKKMRGGSPFREMDLSPA
jgi:hypothetical protein